MHKFFCNYNNLTQRYELSQAQGLMFNRKVEMQKETPLLGKIKNDLQSLYDIIVSLKEGQNEGDLLLLEESELLLSNLFHSLFASPLEIKNTKPDALGLQKGIDITFSLEKDINIPEYNRIILLIKNNLLQVERHQHSPVATQPEHA